MPPTIPNTIKYALIIGPGGYAISFLLAWVLAQLTKRIRNVLAIILYSPSLTGGTLMGTVSSSGGSVSNLVYGTSYYLYPSFSSGYELSSWAKNDSATNSSLSSTTSSNPTYKIGAGNGKVTVTSKSSCQSSVSGTMQAFDPSKICDSVTS